MKRKHSVFIALVSVLLTVFVIWYTQRAVSPKQAGWDDVLAEAARGGYQVISTEDLAKRYFDEPSDLLLVDTRQEWEYRTGHMKGAVNFPMEPTWWARLSVADEMEEFLGPNKDRLLVFY